MARTIQISKEKWQSIITWRHHSIQNISRTFKVSSSAVAKTIKRYDETGKEDPEVPLLQRISSLEWPASDIAAQINASQCSSNRHISTSTVQRRLRESVLHGQIAAKKPPLKDTNKKKKLAWAKKHDRRTLDWWKSVILVWWVQILRFLVPTTVSQWDAE